MDPSTTRNEVLADSVGLRLAYHAYLSWEARHYAEPSLPALPLDARQMFFVAQAQVLGWRGWASVMLHI